MNTARIFAQLIGYLLLGTLALGGFYAGGVALLGADALPWLRTGVLSVMVLVMLALLAGWIASNRREGR